MTPINPIASEFLSVARKSLHHSLTKITHCLNQLDDPHMAWRPFDTQNSLTNIILHLCGNLPQWIISSATGAPDLRNRPAEFSDRTPLPRHELLARLSAVITEADHVLAGVTPETLLEPRRIMDTNVTVLAAIFDSVEHLKGHTHQIVYITRLILREKYKFHWTPA